MKLRLASVLCVLVLLFTLLSACGGAPDDSPEEIVNVPVYKSALTGLPVESEEVSHRRPVAIMINNIKKALPQYGISKAGIVFEALAEGGITRLLAVYDDLEGVSQIGTVRSARPYYLDFAQGLDAIYVHIGGSPEAYSEIKSRGMDSFDLIEGRNDSMYWRDKARIQQSGYEHSVFTSGDRIVEKITERGMRDTRSSSYGDAFNFSEDVVYEGSDALDISATFSPYKTGRYTYDEDIGLYRIEQYDTAHMDALVGSQIAFKNVFVLRMNSQIIKGDTAGRLRFDTVGSGEGMYFVNGTKTDFTWSKASTTAPFVFTLSDGSELPVVPGDSYVAIVPPKAEVNIEGEAQTEENTEENS